MLWGGGRSCTHSHQWRRHVMKLCMFRVSTSSCCLVGLHGSIWARPRPFPSACLDQEQAILFLHESLQETHGAWCRCHVPWLLSGNAMQTQTHTQRHVPRSACDFH